MTAVRFRFILLVTLALFVLLWPRPSHSAVSKSQPLLSSPGASQRSTQR